MADQQKANAAVARDRSLRKCVADAVTQLDAARTSLETAVELDEKSKLGGRELRLLSEQVVDLHIQATMLSARL